MPMILEAARTVSDSYAADGSPFRLAYITSSPARAIFYEVRLSGSTHKRAELKFELSKSRY
jgi:hypothetical protein